MKRGCVIALLFAVPGCLEPPEPQDPPSASPPAVSAEDLKLDPLVAGRRLIDHREEDDNLARAIRILDAQSERNPQSASLHLLAAEAYSRTLEDMGDRKSENRAAARPLLSKGMAHADEAVRLDPESGAAYYWKGCLLLHEADIEQSLGRAKEGLAVLEKAESLVPSIDQGGPARMRGRVLQELPWIVGGSTSKAIACYKKSLEVAPECMTSHLWLGEAYAAAGKEDLARKEWEWVVGAKPRPGHEKEDGADQKNAAEKLKSLKK